MPNEPSEIKWNDIVRLIVVSCTTFVAAFAPLLQIFPHIEGIYIFSKGPKPLDAVSIAANMSLAICLLGFASGLASFLALAFVAADGAAKVFFTVVLSGIGVMCLFDRVTSSTLTGIMCLLWAAISWIPKVRCYVRDHGKQVVIIAWLTVALTIVAFYKHLDIGPMAAYPLSQFGPHRLQFAIFGAEGYLFVFFWASLKIFKKDLLGRDKDDPVLYVSPTRYVWLSVYLPLIGVGLFFIFGIVATAIMSKFGASAWTMLTVFLIGQAFFAASVLLSIFVKKIVIMRGMTA